MVLLPILVFARRARLERAIEQTESLLEEKDIQQTNTLAVLQTTTSLLLSLSVDIDLRQVQGTLWVIC